MGTPPLLSVLYSSDISEQLFSALSDVELVILSRASRPIKHCLSSVILDRREDWLDTLPQDRLSTQFLRAFPRLIR